MVETGEMARREAGRDVTGLWAAYQRGLCQRQANSAPTPRWFRDRRRKWPALVGREARPKGANTEDAGRAPTSQPGLCAVCSLQSRVECCVRWIGEVLVVLVLVLVLAEAYSEGLLSSMLTSQGRQRVCSMCNWRANSRSQVMQVR